MLNSVDVRLVSSDISPQLAREARHSAQVALDVETTGLDWRTAHLATVQVCVPGRWVEVIKVGNLAPSALLEILEAPNLEKVFHHAMFDLRFLSSRWSIEPSAIACTKVAAKTLRATVAEVPTSLKPLVSEYLGVELDKALQVSDWEGALTPDQLAYAAGDVLYLVPLLTRLREKLAEGRLVDLFDKHCDFIPWRLKADLLGVGDAFAY